LVKSRPEKRNLDDVSEFEVAGKSGDFIFREGDAGAALYLVQEGAIELVRVLEGRERCLTRLESGDFFGELSLLEEHPHGVSARALGDYKLLEIDRPTLDRMVDENPQLAIRMLSNLAGRLRQRQEEALRHAGDEEDEPVDTGEAPPQPAAEPLPEKPDTGPEEPSTASADAQPTDEPTTAALIHEDSGTEYELPAKPELVVGRADPVSGIVPDVDLSGVDSQRTLSRRHVKILSRDDGFFLQEEGGAGNGTFVNGERVESGVPVKLEPGDKVRFGFVETVFEHR
jgi:pSer/pThr/pTyr-binding forkhead associated (FHA) protein